MFEKCLNLNLEKMLEPYKTTFLFFFYRWPVDQTKREAAGTEECRRMDAMLEGLIETETLLHRGLRLQG